MKYTLPVSFNVNLEIEGEGTSIQDSFANFQRDMGRGNEDARRAILAALLTKDDTLLDLLAKLIKCVPLDTVELDEEEAESLNPKNVYSIEVTRTISVSIEVEAYSEDDAEEIVSEGLENGDYEEEFEDEMCRVSDEEIGRITLERQVVSKTNLC